MPALVRRQVAVVLLTLAAGAAAWALGGREPRAPELPAVGTLTAGTAWRADSVSSTAVPGLADRQWLLRDGAGHQALLYVGVTARVQTMLGWSGELGYQGQGYVPVGHRDLSLRASDGSLVPAGETTVRHLADRRVVRYAVIGPGGVGREGRDLALHAAWDVARGRPAAYYMVRVAAVEGAGDRGEEVLAGVLSRLVAAARRR